MSNEEMIVNKIVTKETIIEVAKYLESLKNEYDKKFEADEEKNKDLPYNEKVYEYDKISSKIEYTIKYKEGKEITQSEYNWFEKSLINTRNIERITLQTYISYNSNIKNKDEKEYMNLDIWIYFYEDIAKVRMDGKNLEDQVHKIHSYIRGLIENNDDRYNKTIKNREIRIQSFCFTVGFVLSYIIYMVLFVNKSNIPTELVTYLDNKYVLVIGQWILAAIVGNLLGYPIMMAFYRNLLPSKKYSHYSSSSKKSVYVDNIEEYTSHNEVQIGKFSENGKNRENIEKIYKISVKVVLIQLLLSIIFFLVLK